ncbi:hypothetical protein [Luteolibacter soli]|uniref:Ice-binding protein C-terminal domain-containing protein n=1 Tax=Luteolibacter soli TaxID=3135280 RepID=A0ABU9AZ48_9BACT
MKIIAPLAIVAASLSVVNAVTVTLVGVANTPTGFITYGTTTLASGSAYFYSSSVDLNAAQVASVTTRAAFEALLTADPGLVRGAVAFTNGTLVSSGATEMGAVGNKTYLFFEGADGIGIYQGPSVPALGAITMNATTMIEDLKGTSLLQNNGSFNSGFQLVPEPSIALLGALGALGLLRRRR